MKHIFTSLILICFSLSVFSQTPEKISYQAIIRSNENGLVINSNVSIKIIVRQESAEGNSVFEEKHAVSTNRNGLISLEIGTGNITKGSFENIAWEESTYFVETQVDIDGGSNYTIIGSSQLLSVPYALHSKTAEKITGTIEALPYRAKVFSLTSSRNIISEDINNTIACTTSATYTIPANFLDMEIGDTINLEAHNGAVLTVNASPSVTLNYTESGNARFYSKAGNVRFGLLRKAGDNAYIISGQ